LGDKFIEARLLISRFVLLIPIDEILAASKNSSSSLIDSFLDFVKIRRKTDKLSSVLKSDIDFEERLQSSGQTLSFLSTDSVLHLVEGVLGGVEEGLVKVPEVVALDSANFSQVDGINMGVDLV